MANTCNFGISAGGGSNLTITVTVETGSTVTATKGDKTVSGTSSDGVCVLRVPEAGEWMLTATKNSEETTASVHVTDHYAVAMPYGTIYGISRDVTSSTPAWTRTDAGLGKTAVASVGTVAGHSDFDACMPWSGITRETLSTGDVMVKIPKFYYQRYKEGNIEHIRISDYPTIGFAVHPLFNHAGVAADYAYIGAYKTSSNNRSVSGATPQVQQTRAAFRTYAKSKGTGWGLLDIAALSAIQMLFLVEFASNDAKTVIGKGNSHQSSITFKNSGTCNSVPNLTGRPSGTNDQTDIVWRGIEGLWGNAWDCVDGVNFNNGTYYICNDPSKYADDTTTDYEQLSYTISGSLEVDHAKYITEMGIDSGSNSHIMLPCNAGSGSSSTYYCDGMLGNNTNFRVCMHGGNNMSDAVNGLFTIGVSVASSSAGSTLGARLMYLPS